MDNSGQLEKVNSNLVNTANSCMCNNSLEETYKSESVQTVSNKQPHQTTDMTTVPNNSQATEPAKSEISSQFEQESQNQTQYNQSQIVANPYHIGEPRGQAFGNFTESETIYSVLQSTAVNNDYKEGRRCEYYQESEYNEQNSNYCQEIQRFSSVRQASNESLQEESDSKSCCEDSVSSYQTDTDSGFGSIRNNVNITSSFKVKDSRQVQIGSTIDVHGPTTVTDGSWQNLSIRPELTSTQVHLHGSEAHIGTRVNYNGPVNMIKTVKLNTIEYEELERMATEDQKELPQESSGATRVGAVKFITREDWGAKPPLEPFTSLQHPVSYVVLMHTGTEESATEENCKALMRVIQQRFFECANWVDVCYNFLIGGDGNVYEGRGWDFKGAFAEEYNTSSIGLGMIGNFGRVLPSNKQLRALVYCIQEGVRLGSISQDYKILTHQQLKGSVSPGTAFIRLIKTWPRWSETPRHEVIESPRYSQWFSGQKNQDSQELAFASQSMQKLSI